MSAQSAVQLIFSSLERIYYARQSGPKKVLMEGGLHVLTALPTPSLHRVQTRELCNAKQSLQSYCCHCHCPKYNVVLIRRKHDVQRTREVFSEVFEN